MKIYTINKDGNHRIIISSKKPKAEGEMYETEFKEGELMIKDWTNEKGETISLAEIK